MYCNAFRGGLGGGWWVVGCGVIPDRQYFSGSSLRPSVRNLLLATAVSGVSREGFAPTCPRFPDPDFTFVWLHIYGSRVYLTNLFDFRSLTLKAAVQTDWPVLVVLRPSAPSPRRGGYIGRRAKQCRQLPLRQASRYPNPSTVR
jgi:hypothetical protein